MVVEGFNEEIIIVFDTLTRLKANVCNKDGYISILENKRVKLVKSVPKITCRAMESGKDAMKIDAHGLENANFGTNENSNRSIRESWESSKRETRSRTGIGI